MRILFAGDLVGEEALYRLVEFMPRFREEHEIDFALINAENASGGLGIAYALARELLASGFDAITLGNHCWDQPDLCERIEDEERIVRPLNLERHAAGRGYVYLSKAGKSLLLISLLGEVYMHNSISPFQAVDAFLEKMEPRGIKHIFVDFHAQATAEKKAMGYFLDGRVSVVCGTHTHVQTADETILPSGTGYLSDVGMTGVRESVIGMRIENSMRRLAEKKPASHALAKGAVWLSAIMVELDDETGLCLKIERLNLPLN